MARFIEERVNDLEKEIAELKVIVHQLRKPSTVVVEVDGDTAELAKAIEKTTTKTPNELRAEIIDKAKGFVFEVEGYLAGSKSDRTQGNYAYQDTSGYVKYNTNAEKRTVVALFYNKHTNMLMEKGIAKCDPSDVFNEHIGKAIALGRALGLDVSEFEQAVQPTQVEVGHTLEYESIKYEVTEIVGDFAYTEPGTFFELDDMEDVSIINDTNAIYEVK